MIIENRDSWPKSKGRSVEGGFADSRTMDNRSSGFSGRGIAASQTQFNANCR